MFLSSLTRVFVLASAAALLAVSTGCAQPAEIDGTTLGDAFHIQDDAPEVKGSALHRQIVFAEDDGEMLRTLALKFSEDDAIVIGEKTPLSATSTPTVEASIGTLVTFTRPDGVVVKVAENFRQSKSKGGYVVFEQLAPFFAGTFHAEMDDGGILSGTFVVAP